MEKQVGSIITSVLLALTFGFWLTALVTPGWVLLEIKTSSSSSSITNALFEQSNETNFTKRKVTTEVDVGLFFINLCINDDCEQIDYQKLIQMSMRRYQLQATSELFSFEIQLEGVLPLLLCTISCLLAMIPGRFKSTRYLVALILMSNAVSFESILICRYASANAKISVALDLAENMSSFRPADTSIELKFPYSILVAGFGALLGILGCVSSAIMYRKSRDCAKQEKVLNVNAAPASGFTILQETY